MFRKLIISIPEAVVARMLVGIDLAMRTLNPLKDARFALPVLPLFG